MNENLCFLVGVHFTTGSEYLRRVSRPSQSVQYLCLFFKDDFIRFAFTLSTSQKYMVKNSSWFVKIIYFINFFHMGAIFCCFPDMLMSSTYTDGKLSLISMKKKTFHNSLLFPIQVPIEFLQTVIPTTILQLGVHKFFVREVPLDLQCLTMI